MKKNLRLFDAAGLLGRSLSCLSIGLFGGWLTGCASKEDPAEEDRIAMTAPGKWLVVTPPSSPNQGTLGSGWNTVSQQFNDGCLRLKAPPIERGASVTSADLTGRLTASQVASSLGFSHEGRFNGFGVTASLDAKFFREVEDQGRSLALYFQIEANEPSLLMDHGPGSYEILEPSLGLARCGDGYVSQVDRGGKLLVMYKISFASEQAKTRFELQIGGGYGSFIEGKDTYAAALKSFQESFSVKTMAIQIGGDSAKVGTALRLCTKADLKECSDKIDEALRYASQEFGASIKDRPAILRYHVSPWSRLGVDARGERDVREDVKKARQTIDEALRGTTVFQARLSSGSPADLQRQNDERIAALTGSVPGGSLIERCYDRLGGIDFTKDMLSGTEEALISACIQGVRALPAGLDPRLLDPRTRPWGGMFTVEKKFGGTEGALVHPNPAAPGGKCPPGYEAVLSANGLPKDGGDFIETYMCFAEMGKLAPSLLYMGQFSNLPCSPEKNEKNPYTGEANCPAGSATYPMGRLKLPDSSCYAEQYLCLLPDRAGGLKWLDGPPSVLGGHQLGGDMDCEREANTIYNLAYSTPQCPAGTAPRKYVRSLGLKRQWTGTGWNDCGVDKYVCLSS